MNEIEAPGESSAADISTFNQSTTNVSVTQIELEDDDTDIIPISEDCVLDKLAEYPYQVFVLSEYGRPIFVSCGYEEQLCSLFALIGVFVSRVKIWGDRLISISSGEIHVHFSHRSPLILCIVSRTPEQLDEQLGVLFDQITSTLSRTQLETVYKKKGDNYDLRRLLKGTDRYMESCVSSWRADISLFQSAIRIIPMQPSDRDYLSSTMSSCISAAKLDGVLFGLMIAHRQIATIVRLKRYVIHPRDTHILINLITGNSSLQISEAQTWTPICLPYFNDSGFMYAYIAFPWEGSAACLILLSVKKDHFDPLNDVKKRIVEKLESNTKFFSSFLMALKKPAIFNISQIGAGSEYMWSFVYKNRASRQICLSNAKIPLISREERREVRRLVEKVTHLIREEPHMRCLFLRRKRDNLLVWVTDKFELQCIFSPFVSAQLATNLVDRLLKSLKYHEQRYFILHSLSFQ